MSSGSAEDLSDENGVLRLGSGRSWFRCLEIRERRGLARRPLDARAASCPRPESNPGRERLTFAW